MFTAAALLLALTPAAPQAKDYAQPNLLIEPAFLAQPDNLKKFRILDTRTQQQFEAGHPPRAFWIDVPAWKKAFKGAEDQAGWSQRIGGLGIADTAQPVVIYGDQPETARMWWILRFWGLKDVRILNGGFAGWEAVNGNVVKGALPAAPPTVAKLEPVEKLLTTKDQLIKALNDKSLAVIDARTEAEYSGAKAQAKKGGTIPGSCHLDWVGLIDPKTKRFKTAEELDKLFKNAGIDLAKPSVTFCQSGGRASVMAFTLELMGAKDVRNYYNSWSEWGNATDTPIVTPKKN